MIVGKDKILMTLWVMTSYFYKIFASRQNCRTRSPSLACDAVASVGASVGKRQHTRSSWVLAWTFTERTPPPPSAQRRRASA